MVPVSMRGTIQRFSEIKSYIRLSEEEAICHHDKSLNTVIDICHRCLVQISVIYVYYR
jgi:hypothetical protein